MTPAADSSLIVELVDVHKSYSAGTRTSPVLEAVDMRVHRGEFVSLMGPSGSGKTTLLNIIAGLDVPDRGRVVLDGNDLHTLRDHELADLRLRAVGFVFQAFNLIPSLTVANNVAWPLEFAALRRGEVQTRVAQALERVGIAGCERMYPGDLSGGEQQRVAIARAIAPGPHLLLADEPTGNLDSYTGRVILDLLQELRDGEGVTVVMVTHNEFAASYGDRTLELRDGRIIRDVSTTGHAPGMSGGGGARRTR